MVGTGQDSEFPCEISLSSIEGEEGLVQVLGADEYVKKPFSPEELRSKVEALVDRAVVADS